MSSPARRARSTILGIALVALCACATRGSYRPATAADVGFFDRAVTETRRGVTVIGWHGQVQERLPSAESRGPNAAATSDDSSRAFWKRACARSNSPCAISQDAA